MCLEAECGLANGTINKWDTKRPSVDRLAAVASFFSVSLDYLLTGEEPTLIREFTASSLRLSDRERDLILAYRARPDMQLAVDRLLGLDEKEKASHAFDAKDA